MDSGDGDEWPGRWDGRETDSGTGETADDDGWSDERADYERADDGNEAGSERGDDGRGIGADGGSDERNEVGLLVRARWLMNTDEEWIAFVREVLSSLAVVAIIGLVLFAVSGLWPPMVAIESPSMEPHMERGDLVFLMEEHRLAGGAAYNGTGVVPYQSGAAAGYKEFSEYGDVIVYQPDGNERTTPIIHRARFWVNASENWYDEANEEYLGGAESCEELANCPAPHAGFITKGDNNGLYDQVDTGSGAISSPVKPEWIVGTAEFKIPWLGQIRLLFGAVGASGAPPASSVPPLSSVSPANPPVAHTSWRASRAAVGAGIGVGIGDRSGLAA